MTNTAIIIPSRMDSTRFPGKPLAQICGIPMIGHCYHRAILSNACSDVYVATCDSIIKDYVESIGGNVIITSTSHNRATTRTAEAIQKIEADNNKQYDVVLMLQGDEPLVSPTVFSPLLNLFKASNVKIANLISPILDHDVFINTNNVKVVTDDYGHALYFSREPIPSPWKGFSSHSCFQQTGIIAFRRDTLFKFNALDESSLEIIESIDMNRVLQTRLCDIHVLMSSSPTLGVDTPEDLASAASLMINDPFFRSYSK